jgi:hypothetical protein
MSCTSKDRVPSATGVGRAQGTASTFAPNEHRPTRGNMELDESSAREKASRLATAKFRVANLTDAAGNLVPPESPPPSAFRARVDGGRWYLSFGGPAGAWAVVSFDLAGRNESVEVGFAAD